MLGLRDLLMKSKKDFKSIVDYMQPVNGKSIDLAFIGHRFNDDDLIIHVLNGLGTDYKELCATIQVKVTLISFKELYDKWLNHESFLKRHGDSKVSSLLSMLIELLIRKAVMVSIFESMVLTVFIWLQLIYSIPF